MRAIRIIFNNPAEVQVLLPVCNLTSVSTENQAVGGEGIINFYTGASRLPEAHINLPKDKLPEVYEQIVDYIIGGETSTLVVELNKKQITETIVDVEIRSI